MKFSVVTALGAGLAFLAAHGALAEGTFQQHYSDCVDKYAAANMPASVMLECTAGGGKLDACQVKENSAPGKGFDKAAICVAKFLPMGAKSGVVQVPIKFAGV
ncbi:MAG: hypothetical protein WA840_17380 [Caulobacteraceae bacterium]